MKAEFWYDLSLFGESVQGGEVEPALTPQASGDCMQAAPAAEEQSKETRKEAFRSMMEGEFKDLFREFFQETFNRRFKGQKSMMEELERARGVVEAAAEHYGTRDEAALSAAIRAEKEKLASAEAASAPSSRDVSEDAADSKAIEAAVQAAVERAREETERAVTASIRARGLRPSEGALTPGVGGYFKGGAAQLTRSERADMARRAAKGERIEF
ncbi:MAG: hypothetical protein IJW51_04875 [Clostridia bacterium]|nr:hypothetical protein [Clostridia bacterium]MBQ9802385.1 hypothetical protein [Clostridia bacterium]